MRKTTCGWWLLCVNFWGFSAVGTLAQEWPLDDNNLLQSWGFINVAGAPFHADPTGTRDSTQAIQAAIDYARQRQLVCLFPPGEYLVSDTLVCEQYRPLQTPTRRTGDRNHPCVLVGMEMHGRRPCLVLSPQAQGFDDPENPKPVVYFWAAGNGVEVPLDRPQPNISMNQMMIGIDVRLGPNHPGALGISHRAAQGSGVQDCVIDARGAYCGLAGGAGSGGSHAGVTVIGGRYGLDMTGTQPAATLTGITLIDQEEAAVLCSGRQATTIVGFRIQATHTKPLVRAKQNWIHQGQINLIDGVVEVESDRPGVLLHTDAASYLNNVFVRGIQTIVESPMGKIATKPNEWTHIDEAAVAVPPPPLRGKYVAPLGLKELQYTCHIYLDGRRWPDPLWYRLSAVPQPPADLVKRHLWPDDFPRPWSPGVVNVKTLPNAPRGDGIADDTEALQQAIDRYPRLFLPKGEYRITRTLRLRPDSQLVGAHRCFSWIVGYGEEKGDFAGAGQPQPMIATAEAQDARCILGFFGIRLDITATSACALKWRSGPHSVFRDVNVVMPSRWNVARGARAPLFDHPLVVIRGHGGGKWYNFHQESWHLQGPNYRHLLIERTQGPLWFYQCNVEHARSEANMEIRDASNVFIFGLKSEYNRPVLRITNTHNCALFGYGGNAAAFPGTALFEVRDCRDYRFTLLVDTPRFPGNGSPDHFAGEGVDPREWFMLREIEGSTEFRIPPLDRPTLIGRGTLVRVLPD